MTGPSLAEWPSEALFGELARRGLWVLEHDQAHARVVLDQVLEVKAALPEATWPDLHPTISAEACQAELGLLAAATLRSYVDNLQEGGEVYWAAVLVARVAGAVEASTGGNPSADLLLVAATALQWIEAIDRRPR